MMSRLVGTLGVVLRVSLRVQDGTRLRVLGRRIIIR